MEGVYSALKHDVEVLFMESPGVDVDGVIAQEEDMQRYLDKQVHIDNMTLSFG